MTEIQHSDAKTVFTWDTKLSADSAEWYENVLAIGTYQVDKSDQDKFSDKQRHGSILLFRALEVEDDIEKDSFELIKNIETGAILDMKWYPLGHPYLATCTSSGDVIIYDFSQEMKIKARACLENRVILSLDWNCRRSSEELKESAKKQLVISDNQGYISICDVDLQSGEIQIQEPLIKHDFEAWITVFDAWDNNIVYSGGDDMKLYKTDIRTKQKIVFGKNEHNAGVTSLYSDIFQEHRLVSGSYDETLRIWDTRNTKFPRLTYNAGGGIWRIRQPRDPTKKNILGLACMHNGFQIIEEGPKDCSLITDYKEHESLAYGLDFRCKDSSTLQLASCSFYDHLLKIWNVTY